MEVGVLAKEARRQNEAYLHRVRTGRAFVSLKAAVTLDGRLGADGGDSRWITGEEARRRARELRDEHDVVLVGRRTLERDDPSLDVRLPGDRRDPVAVVVDSTLSSPLDRRLFDRAAAGARVILATRADAPAERAQAFTDRGVEVLRVGAGAAEARGAGGGSGGVDLDALLTYTLLPNVDYVIVVSGFDYSETGSYTLDIN